MNILSLKLLLKKHQELTQERFPSSHLAFGISFLLQRIIRHLPLSCVIIFLYLKRGREPLFARIYAATTLGIDGRMIEVEVDVSPGLPGFELVGLPDTSVKELTMFVRAWYYFYK